MSISIASDINEINDGVYYVQALYDYPARDPNELPFEEHDIIIIFINAAVDERDARDWAFGENKGLFGFVPLAFVRRLTVQETRDAASLLQLRHRCIENRRAASVVPLFVAASFDSLCTNSSASDPRLFSRMHLSDASDSANENEANTDDIDGCSDRKDQLDASNLVIDNSHRAAQDVSIALSSQALPPTIPTLVITPNQESVSRLKVNETFSGLTPTPKKSWLSNIGRKSSTSSTASSNSSPEEPSSAALVTPTNLLPSIQSNSAPKLADLKPSAVPRTTRSVSQVSPHAQHKKLWIDIIGGSAVCEKLNIGPSERKRQEIIYEIITTERDYVLDLEIVRNVWMERCRASKIVQGKDISVIFSNIEAILPVNSELLKRLEERQAMHTNHIIEQIGDIFIKVSDYLKMYTMYCSNHPYALMKLQSIRQSRAATKFLDSIAALPECRNLDLPNFLLKPIQRICKYPLLLRELIKVTPAGHADYENLKIALSKIETVVAIVNEGTRMAENVQKMLDLQARLITKINVVMPSRLLIKNGQIDYISKKSERKRCELYLFNDMLILAKPTSDQTSTKSTTASALKLMAFVPFDMILISCPSFSSIQDLKGKTKQENTAKEIYLIEVVHVNSAKFLLATENLNLRTEWVHAMQDATSEWLSSKNNKICVLQSLKICAEQQETLVPKSNANQIVELSEVDSRISPDTLLQAAKDEDRQIVSSSEESMEETGSLNKTDVPASKQNSTRKQPRKKVTSLFSKNSGVNATSIEPRSKENPTESNNCVCEKSQAVNVPSKICNFIVQNHSEANDTPSSAKKYPTGISNSAADIIKASEKQEISSIASSMPEFESPSIESLPSINNSELVTSTASLPMPKSYSKCSLLPNNVLADGLNLASSIPRLVSNEHPIMYSDEFIISENSKPSNTFANGATSELFSSVQSLPTICSKPSLASRLERDVESLKQPPYVPPSPAKLEFYEKLSLNSKASKISSIDSMPANMAAAGVFRPQLENDILQTQLQILDSEQIYSRRASHFEPISIQQDQLNPSSVSPNFESSNFAATAMLKVDITLEIETDQERNIKSTCWHHSKSAAFSEKVSSTPSPLKYKIDSFINDSATTIHEENAKEVRQLEMNKPVKKVVVYNVTQQSGRKSKSFSIIDLPVRVSRSPYVMKFFRVNGHHACAIMADLANENAVEEALGTQASVLGLFADAIEYFDKYDEELFDGFNTRVEELQEDINKWLNSYDKLESSVKDDGVYYSYANEEINSDRG
ncbi:Myosin 10A, isoform D [Physocladia obscura]|uniref:Myosin 10A, isoform D n=1 Tax=Physocladia obscura TaxID=109957 RepID=A0AAD5SXP9_9FUNG|nr:Myosin 10A, isoform D [Physocladia obscura]